MIGPLLHCILVCLTYQRFVHLNNYVCVCFIIDVGLTHHFSLSVGFFSVKKAVLATKKETFWKSSFLQSHFRNNLHFIGDKLPKLQVSI